MLFTVVGIFGFLGFLLFDLFSLNKMVTWKYVAISVGLFLIVLSTVLIVRYPSTMIVPLPLRVVGLILAVLFTALLIYSVFVEVGLSTYRRFSESNLVTSGTYSLVRHPGVIWLFLAYFFASLYFANEYLLITAFVWTFVNTVYIMIQEELILVKLFQDYEQYRRTTPMIIPNLTSIRRFIESYNWRKE